MLVAEIVIVAIVVYVAIGVVFAVWFVINGAARIDPVARSGTVAFRLLILPGSAALWPALLFWSLRSSKRGAA